MHIQHVVTHPESRVVARSVWLISTTIKADVHSLFLISDHNDRVWLQDELKPLKLYRGQVYTPAGQPDCTILHSLRREHIRDIDDSTLCIQQTGELSPSLGVRTIAFSRKCANIIRADDYFNVCGVTNDKKPNDNLVIGLIIDNGEEAGYEEGLMIQGIAKALPHTRFLLPYGDDSFRAMVGPDTGYRASYRHRTEGASGMCDISIFTSHENWCGDLVANALLSGSVPVVSSRNCHHEYVPTRDLVYTTYHQAMKISCRLARERGLLDEAKSYCKKFYDANLTMPVFRSKMGRQLSKVVATAGANTWI